MDEARMFYLETRASWFATRAPFPSCNSDRWIATRDQEEDCMFPSYVADPLEKKRNPSKTKRARLRWFVLARGWISSPRWESPTFPSHRPASMLSVVSIRLARSFKAPFLQDPLGEKGGFGGFEMKVCAWEVWLRIIKPWKRSDQTTNDGG